MDILKSFLIIIFLGSLTAFSLHSLSDSIELKQETLELNSEIVGYVQTSDIFGQPIFLKILRFENGIELRFNISAEEYFENKE